MDAEAALHDLERLGPLGRFSTSTVHRAFGLALAKLGSAGVRSYDLRHSYGTAMYQVTGETRIVKELLGYSTATTTERYTLRHVPAHMQVAAARFEELTTAPDQPRPCAHGPPRPEEVAQTSIGWSARGYSTTPGASGRGPLARTLAGRRRVDRIAAISG